jgi:hypothetical protein
MAKDGEAPFGPNREGMSRFRHNENDVWRCRVCGYWPNVDKRSKFCISCGRDYWGNEGTIPTDVGDPRPQVYKVGYVEDDDA